MDRLRICSSFFLPVEIGDSERQKEKSVAVCNPGTVSVYKRDGNVAHGGQLDGFHARAKAAPRQI